MNRLPAKLSPSLTEQILHHFGTPPPDVPTPLYLSYLIIAYSQTVPWESASRIVRRSQTTHTADCPRWAEEFWQTHCQYGTGGTCFESNYAFAALLHSLGYEGYLTINNMGEQTACHTAIVILIKGEKWLVDVGIPIYRALPLNPHKRIEKNYPIRNYTIQPLNDDLYEIWQAPYPNLAYVYTLIDQPISLDHYRQATIQDYAHDGLFLDKVVLNKVLGGVPCRFNSSDNLPYAINAFWQGVRTDTLLEEEGMDLLAAQFGVNAGIIAQALAIVADKQT